MVYTYYNLQTQGFPLLSSKKPWLPLRFILKITCFVNFDKYVIMHANKLHPTESFQHPVLTPSYPKCWFSPYARKPRGWNSAMHCFCNTVTWIRMFSVPFGGLVTFNTTYTTVIYEGFLVLMIKIKLLQTPAHGYLGK